jgi:tetratricopeptide (TPR) repeat protein
MGKEDLQRLYLRSLGALRARPWNYFIRLCFHRIVGGNSIAVHQTSLYDAALVFLHKREAENPDEGSWYSLEAFLRLSKRGEVAEAKKLFATANAKGAKDVECRIFPLLLAEMDGNIAEAGRLRQRALKDWPRSEDLDRVLLDSLSDLPTELNERARETFGKKYARAHPADWSSRVERLRSTIWDAERKKIYGDASALPSAYRAVESETTMLLSLPVSALPEPHRVEFLAMGLRAKAGLGKCGEVSPEIPAFEAETEMAYPRRFESGSQPRPRTARDVKELRARIGDERRGIEEFRRALTDGSLENAAEWRDVPKEERLKFLREALAMAEREVVEGDSLLREADDASVAAEWTRRELAEWEKAHNLPSSEFLTSYDLRGRGEGLQIGVRSAQGQCLLANGMALEAANVLKPCVGGGRNFHSDCIAPLVEAGVALARSGDVREAAAIFNLVEPSSTSTDGLFEAIEAKAPGTVRKKTPVPVAPMPRP